MLAQFRGVAAQGARGERELGGDPQLPVFACEQGDYALTGDDCDVPYGVIPIACNEFPLARERVRYRGEPVAAVAAVDEPTARAALAVIVLDLEPLPAVFDAKSALATGAVQMHEDKPGNIEREVEQIFGDVEAGFAAAGPGRSARPARGPAVFRGAPAPCGRASAARAAAT